MRQNFKYVFLFTHGRSGSTVLMKLINRDPKVLMRGESRGSLYFFWKGLDALREAREFWLTGGTRETNSPWYGIDTVPREAMEDMIADMFVRDVLQPVEGKEILGFKEVRFQPNIVPDRKDFMGYIKFLMAQFPDLKIIFLTRDWQDVATSGWYASMDRDLVQERITETHARFARAAERFPEQAMMFDYANLKAGDPKLRALLDFAGLTLSDEVVNDVLGVKLTHMSEKKQGLSLTDRAKRKMKRIKRTMRLP